jgi:hypothetical protein
MRLRLKLASVFVLLAAVLAACSTPPATKSAPLPPGASGKVGALEPGMTDLGGGRVVASGWLTEVDLEGGMWQVVSQPPSSSLAGVVVAVILPTKVIADELDGLRGTFIGAEGTLQTGASTRMAGPEVVVDAIRVY